MNSNSNSSNSSVVKNCPIVGCHKQVSFVPDQDNVMAEEDSLSHSVDCGIGHYFCWECGTKEAHAPVGCKLWSRWKDKCGHVDMKPTAFNWLVSHFRPCPACGFATQKSDGCNRCLCAKCGYDFCWVCLNSLQQHPMCNRYLDANMIVVDANDNNNSSGSGGGKWSKADAANRTVERFIHFFIRYRNHANSLAMEETTLVTVKRKREILLNSASNSLHCHCHSSQQQRRHSMCCSHMLANMQSASMQPQFYDEAVVELMKARSILCASYVYGYFHLESKMKMPKRMFELLQHDLEDTTDRLSEMLSRPFLRTSRRVIVQTTQMCRRKRQDYLKASYNGAGSYAPGGSTSSFLTNQNTAHIVQVNSNDPWMNRNCGGNFATLTKAERKRSAAAAGADGGVGGVGGGGSSGKNSDIWTKTLSHSKAKCKRPGCKNTCNVRSATKNFCSVACSSHYSSTNGAAASASKSSTVSRKMAPMITSATVASSSSSHQKTASYFCTLPRTSKSDDNLLKQSAALSTPSASNFGSGDKPDPESAVTASMAVESSDNVTTAKDITIQQQDGGQNKENEAQNSSPPKTTSVEAAAKRASEAGYVMLTNDGSSSEGTLKKTDGPADPDPTSASTLTTNNKDAANSSSKTNPEVNSSAATVTSKRGSRPRFVRQKSFEIDSDSTDIDGSLAKDTLAPLPDVLSISSEAISQSNSATGSKKGVRKRPALTIKIQNSSFNDADIEDDDVEAIHISGVAISRSPKSGGSVASSTTLSASTAAAATVNRNRSSSLIVPPVISAKSSKSKGGSGGGGGGGGGVGSPGSKSLHLSPKSPLNHHHAHTKQSQNQAPTLFKFPPDPKEISTILHVRESHLSSDDFHEALFFERSPKSGQKKRRKSKRSINAKSETNLSGTTTKEESVI